MADRGAMLRAAAPQATLERAIGYLQTTQLPDGSWRGSRYETALVLGALKGSLAPNLVVPPDGLRVEPSPVSEGVTVSVTARVFT